MIELPRPDIKRWTVRHKAAVILAVRVGLISLQDACLRYNLSVEEFLAWQRAVERHGLPGLRVTRLQIIQQQKSRFHAGFQIVATHDLRHVAHDVVH